VSCAGSAANAADLTENRHARGAGQRPVREGDTLLLMLDCERGCLSAYLNGARLGRLLRAPAQLAAQMPLAWMVELREPGDAVQVALRLPPPGAAEAEDAEELPAAMGGGGRPRGAGAAAGLGGYELDAGTAAAAAAGAEARAARRGGCVCGAVRRLGVSAYLLLCGGGAVALLACVAVRAPDAFLFDATVLAHLGAAGSSHHPHPPTVATAAASPPMRRGWRRRTSEHMCVMMGVAV
jgi:hypothetical protein